MTGTADFLLGCLYLPQPHDSPPVSSPPRTTQFLGPGRLLLREEGAGFLGDKMGEEAGIPTGVGSVEAYAILAAL